jgi:hypothetical protein
MLVKIITWAGNFCGAVIHFFKGCKSFEIFVTGKKGKLKSKHCRRCGKRYDRENGKWKYMGRYARVK